MSNTGAKVVTILFVGGLSWYSGLKFWQPLIIDQLKKDGNLRDDVYVRDTSDQPKSWSDLKEKVKITLHPNLAKDIELSANDTTPSLTDKNIAVEDSQSKQN